MRDSALTRAETGLDEFVPAWQFGDHHSAACCSSARAASDNAVKSISVDEIVFTCSTLDMCSRALRWCSTVADAEQSGGTIMSRSRR